MRFCLFVAWNIHTVLFLPIFVFWMYLLFLIVVIILSPRFFNIVFKSLIRCIDPSTLSSMLTNPLSPFLDTYNLSTLSLGCKALCIVVSFLVLWSIYLSSSLVHLKNNPEYLPRGTAQVFIPLMSFKFPRSEKTSLNFFFHLRLFHGVHFQYFQVLVIIIIIIMSCRQHGYPWPSLVTSPYHSSPPAGLLGYILCPHIAAEHFDFFLGLVFLFFPSCFISRFSLFVWCIFLCQLPSLYPDCISWLYILTACIMVSNSF